MTYLYLAYVFFKIGVFGFGGGYAMISIIQHEVVDVYRWMSATEFADVLAISHLTPGPISINAATYVGYNVCGFWGAVVATFFLCLPAVLLMIVVVSLLFKNKQNPYVSSVMKCLKPIVAGLILAAALLLMNKDNFEDFGERNISVLICVVCFIATHFFKVNPMLIIPICGLVGYLFF